MIHPVHTKLPGRGRYKVRGLFGSKAIKEALETRLLRHRSILQVYASTVTGNVLVLFEKSVDHPRVVALLSEALEAITGTFQGPELQSGKSLNPGT